MQSLGAPLPSELKKDEPSDKLKRILEREFVQREELMAVVENIEDAVFEFCRLIQAILTVRGMCLPPVARLVVYQSPMMLSNMMMGMPPIKWSIVALIGIAEFTIHFHQRFHAEWYLDADLQCCEAALEQKISYTGATLRALVSRLERIAGDDVKSFLNSRGIPFDNSEGYPQINRQEFGARLSKAAYSRNQELWTLA